MESSGGREAFELHNNIVNRTKNSEKSFLQYRPAMSFGVGVGDIVTVTKLVAGLRRRFLDAPEQYRGIRDE